MTVERWMKPRVVINKECFDVGKKYNRPNLLGKADNGDTDNPADAVAKGRSNQSRGDEQQWWRWRWHEL